MPARKVLVTALLLSLPVAAHAHPHEWIDAAFDVAFDGQGRLTAIRHHWLLDKGFTAFALQGLDLNADGHYSAQELQLLADENMQSLEDFDYFTFVSVGNYQSGFAAPTDYQVELAGEQLRLHFTLPLAQPFATKSEIVIQVYDPSYYLAMSIQTPAAVQMMGAPAVCRLVVHAATGPNPEAAALLATLGPDQRTLPEGMRALTGGIDNTAIINCGKGPAAAALPDNSAADAVTLMAAGSTGPAADLRALPREPLQLEVQRVPTAGADPSDLVAARAAATSPPSRAEPQRHLSAIDAALLAGALALAAGIALFLHNWWRRQAP